MGLESTILNSSQHAHQRLYDVLKELRAPPLEGTSAIPQLTSSPGPHCTRDWGSWSLQSHLGKPAVHLEPMSFLERHGALAY